MMFHRKSINRRGFTSVGSAEVWLLLLGALGPSVFVLVGSWSNLPSFKNNIELGSMNYSHERTVLVLLLEFITLLILLFLMHFFCTGVRC